MDSLTEPHTAMSQGADRHCTGVELSSGDTTSPCGAYSCEFAKDVEAARTSSRGRTTKVSSPIAFGDRAFMPCAHAAVKDAPRRFAVHPGRILDRRSAAGQMLISPKATPAISTLVIARRQVERRAIVGSRESRVEPAQEVRDGP